jgi:hypothetical protein
MPHGDQRSVLVDVAKKYWDHSNVAGLLHALAEAGQVLDSTTLVGRCEIEASALRSRRWIEEREWWRFESFFELIPFSEDPGAFLGLLTKLADIRTPPLHKLIAALGASPDARADALLVELARRYPSVARDDAWLRAAEARGSPAITRELAQFAFELDEKGVAADFDYSYFARRLASLLSKHHSVLQDIIRRRSEAETQPRRLIDSILGLVPDESCVLMVLECESLNAQGRGHFPREAIDLLVTDHISHPTWQGAYSVVPRPAAHLRRTLYELTLISGEKARLAKLALGYIDELRRQYGRPDDEPRNPQWEPRAPSQ